MLLSDDELSSIDGVVLSSDATEDGYAAAVEWIDFAKQKKQWTTKYGWDSTPHDKVVGTGAKGPITLVIKSCPPAVFDGLKALLNAAPRVVAHLFHPQLGERRYDVQVVGLTTSGDGQYATGDPLADVTVRLSSHGLAA